MEKLEEEIKDMTPRLIKDLGVRYPTEKSKYRTRYGLYECQYCGGEFEYITNNVNTGNTKSCGCLAQKGNNTSHGLTYHRFYNTWNNMIQRCTNPKNKRYKDYGARGITVCEEWLDVATFISWAEATRPNIEGYSLDRIDNDKGYSPENCRWADKTTQAINQRIGKNNKSGYVGIYYYKKYNTWGADIRINKISKYIGTFKTLEEAVQARDNYIVENNLPNKLSTQY